MHHIEKEIFNQYCWAARNLENEMLHGTLGRQMYWTSLFNHLTGELIWIRKAVYGDKPPNMSAALSFRKPQSHY